MLRRIYELTSVWSTFAPLVVGGNSKVSLFDKQPCETQRQVFIEIKCRHLRCVTGRQATINICLVPAIISDGGSYRLTRHCEGICYVIGIVLCRRQAADDGVHRDAALSEAVPGMARLNGIRMRLNVLWNQSILIH